MQSQIRRRALTSAYLSPSSLLRAENSSLVPLTNLNAKWRRSQHLTRTAQRGFFSSGTKGNQKSETTEKPEGAQGENLEKEAQSPESGVPPQTEENGTPEQKKIKELEASVASLKDEYLRCLADQQNLVRRTKIDVENAKLYGIKGFASSILEVADNLERALATVSPTQKSQIPELESLFNGIEMTEKILIKVLERHGVAKFSPLNEKFNPTQHEAIFEVQDPSKAAGTVAIVQASGYSLNGRLLRPAQVGVVATPPAS